MAFCKQKQVKPVEPVKIECQHKWRDFPWYITSTYNTSNHYYHVEVIEPYVCVWCGKRQDKTLQHIEHTGSQKECISVIEALNDTYKDHIRARAFIENDIADMQLVDRDYLRALAIVNPGALVGMDENAQVALKKS